MAVLHKKKMNMELESISNIPLGNKLKKILIVDDDKDIEWIFHKILGDKGHKVSCAVTYNEGMRKFKNSKYLDIAIVDFKLSSEKNGLMFIKNARKINNNVKFIMISAFGTPELKKKANELGVCSFLDKPMRIERLLQVINEDYFEVDCSSPVKSRI
jgi:DNA-binding NtrC family response regulator